MSSCPKLPFAAGSDGVVERFFGRRTEPPGSPEDLLVRTAEDMRLLVRDVGWRCADLPARTSDGALSDVHDDLRRIAGDLNRESEHIPGADQPLQVVLLGRTQAGKSTLFQYLTGSDGSPLGDGGQRTTQSVVTSRMAGRPDILVVDTPGVGARDGDDDREVALAAARHADLAVWVATSNAQPTETTEVLSQVARWGVPMVLVFNCRVDLTVDGAVHQFLAYPESTFADLEGHRSRLAPFLDRHGQRPLDVLPLHAAAALLGAAATPPHAELLRLSGVDALVTVIQAEADQRRHARRAATTVDVARRALTDAAQRLAAQAADLELLADTQQKELADFGRRAARLVADADLEISSEIQALIDGFDDWADRHYQRSETEIQATWDADIRRLCEAADGLLQAGYTRLTRRLSQLDDDVAAAWSKRLTASLAKQIRIRASGVTPRWVEAGMRTAAGVAGTAIGGVLGAAVGNAPGAYVGAAIGGFVGDWVGSRLLFRRRQVARRRATLHESVRAALGETRQRIEASWRASQASVEQALAEYAAERSRTTGCTTALAEHSRAVAELAMTSSASADRCLLRTLLRLAGRSRLADLVTEVHRVPGFACLVPVPDGAALREFVLWPPEGMIEEVRPIPSGEQATAFRRAAYAVDAGHRHAVLVPDEDGIRAQIPERLSPELLAAEAALVATVSDVPLRLSCSDCDSKETAA